MSIIPKCNLGQFEMDTMTTGNNGYSDAEFDLFPNYDVQEAPKETTPEKIKTVVVDIVKKPIEKANESSIPNWMFYAGFAGIGFYLLKRFKA